ncbi:hypothetical protein LUZ61_018965 [Rhynchospora tenuis]|uniref:RING-type E3 ubiquitin transferase n=1 Tax=Rhynchospora tenuis TaxID=198213 RepID=A0AAD5ZAB8_9POAL|nr:hypothetical protein LUZ61_018965 [Rhynchospora tenuis]
MKPIAASTVTTPQTISAPPSSPSTPHVAASISTVIVFASIITSLLLLGLYCSFTRRRTISNARRRLVHQIHASMSGILVHRPANVSLPVRKYAKEEMQANGKEIEECPVCLVEFEEDEEVKVVDPGCEHMFHPVCIDRWLAMRDTCPVCRSTIVGDEIDWGEVWREGEEWEDANMEMIMVTEEDAFEGGEEQVEVVVNVENLVADGEENSGEERDEEVVISVDGDVLGSEEEGELVVDLESVVLSDDMDVGERMDVVNLESDAEGGEGEVRVTVENEEVDGLEVKRSR